MSLPPLTQKARIAYGFLTILSAPFLLQADTYEWETAGNSNQWGASIGDLNWHVNSAVTLSQWIDGNSAVFNAATGEQVNVIGSVNPSNILVEGAGNWTFEHSGGTIDGGASLVKNGAGTLTFRGDSANTFSGGTLINGGRITLGAGGTGANTSHVQALGTGSITIQSGAALRYWIQNSTTHTFNNSLILNGGSVESEDGNNVIGGPITVQAGGATFSSKFNNKSIRITGTISGDGPVNYSLMSGGSAYSNVYVAGSNNYTGETRIKSGIIYYNQHTSSLGAGGAGNGTYVEAGGTLNLNAVMINPGATPEFLYIAGTGANNSGAITNTNANFNNGVNNFTLTGNATISSPFRWDVRAASGAPNPFIDLAGFTLTKTGTDNIFIVNANTNGGITDGNIIINQGTLGFEGSTIASAGSGKITVNTGGTAGFYNRTSGTFARAIELNGGTLKSVSGGGNNTVASVINVITPSFILNDPSTTLTLQGNITGSADMVLTKNGAGALTITDNAKSYSGTLIVNQGTVNVSNNANLRNLKGLEVNSGAIVNFNLSNILTSGHDTVFANDRTFSINGGTVNLTSGSGRFGNLNLSNGAVMNVNTAGTSWNYYLGQDQNGNNPTVTVNGTVGSNIGYTSATPGELWLAPNTIFDVAQTGGVGPDLTVSVNLEDRQGSSISNPHISGFTKTGEGTMLLTGASTYTGTTTVNQGTLQVGEAGVGSIQSQVNVNADAQLRGSGTIQGNVNLNGAQSKLTPGDESGTFPLKINGNLNLGSGSQFEISSVFGAGDYLLELSTGSVSLNGVELVGDYNGLASGDPRLSDVMWLVNNTGTGTLSGTFANGENSVAWATLLGADAVDLVDVNGVTLAVVYGANYGVGFSGGNDIAVFAAIPEPGRAFLIPLALLPLAIRRSRR